MRQVRIAAAVLAALFLSGCGRRGAPPPPRPAVAAPEDGLAFTLLWSSAADLDLYVTDPTQETVYFANRRAASGGVLEKDESCAGDGEAADPRVETVRWKRPPPGPYRVGVDFGDRCGGADREVAYRLVVRGDGLDREVTGVARLTAFVYQALEIDVGASQSPAR